MLLGDRASTGRSTRVRAALALRARQHGPAARPLAWPGAPAAVGGVGAVALVLAIVYPYPLATGSVIPDERPLQPSAHVRVPDYWRAMAETIDADDRDGKVLVLPLDDYYQMPTTWGFFGVDSIANLLIRHPVVQPKPDGYFGDVAGLQGQRRGRRDRPAGRRPRGRAPAAGLDRGLRGHRAPRPRARAARAHVRRRRGARRGDRPGPGPDPGGRRPSRALAGRRRVERLRPSVRPHAVGRPRAGGRGRSDRHDRHRRTRSSRWPPSSPAPTSPTVLDTAAGHRRHGRLAGSGGRLGCPRARPCG